MSVVLAPADPDEGETRADPWLDQPGARERGQTGSAGHEERKLDVVAHRLGHDRIDGVARRGCAVIGEAVVGTTDDGHIGAPGQFEDGTSCGDGGLGGRVPSVAEVRPDDGSHVDVRAEQLMGQLDEPVGVTAVVVVRDHPHPTRDPTDRPAVVDHRSSRIDRSLIVAGPAPRRRTRWTVTALTGVRAGPERSPRARARPARRAHRAGSRTVRRPCCRRGRRGSAAPADSSPDNDHSPLLSHRDTPMARRRGPTDVDAFRRRSCHRWVVRSSWGIGDVVVRREVIGLEFDGHAAPTARVWFAYPVHVVHDSDDLLVSYVGPRAEFGFVDGRWSTATGAHPWRGRTHWEGHGCLMVQHPRDPYAVWHYWHGPDRNFLCWYVNFQAPLRRTAAGYDTQDFELDIVVFPDGSWRVKDLELIPQRVSEGYISSDVADRVVARRRGACHRAQRRTSPVGRAMGNLDPTVVLARRDASTELDRALPRSARRVTHAWTVARRSRTCSGRRRARSRGRGQPCCRAPAGT